MVVAQSLTRELAGIPACQSETTPASLVPAPCRVFESHVIHAASLRLLQKRSDPHPALLLALLTLPPLLLLLTRRRRVLKREPARPLVGTRLLAHVLGTHAKRSDPPTPKADDAVPERDKDAQTTADRFRRDGRVVGEKRGKEEQCGEDEREGESEVDGADGGVGKR